VKLHPLLLILSLTTHVAMAEVLDLPQAIQEAREHSPTLQRFHAAFEETKWRKFETLGSGFLPNLSANASHYFNEKYELLNVPFNGQQILFPSIYPTSNASIDISIPIFDGFANISHLKAANLNVDASENELSHADFQLEQDIRLAFYQALGAQELESVARQNVKTLEDHLKIAEARKTGGSGTNYDVLRVQVQLTQLLGLRQDSRELRGDLPVPHVEAVQNLVLNDSPEDRTDIRALDLRSEAADQDRSARARWMVPSVSLGADYTFYNPLNNSVTQSDPFHSAYNVGVFLQWKLFDGGVSLARSQEAKYQQVQADRASEEAKDQIPYEFELWKRKYLTNAARYDAKKLDVTRSEESIRLARAEESAGTRNSTEVLDAELDLFRSKAGVVDALLSSAEAQVQLEKTLGRKL
jgi:outer membrane protein TolC